MIREIEHIAGHAGSRRGQVRAAAIGVAIVAVVALAGCRSSGVTADESASNASPTDVASASTGTFEPPSGSGPAVGDTSSGPSVSGHDQVVAQGIVGFVGGDHHWEVSTTTVTTTTSSVGAGGPTFVLSGVAEGVLVGPAGQPPAWRLGEGEAAFHQTADPGSTLDAVAVSTAGGSITTIAPVAGPGPNSFLPGEGQRDVDLVRDVLATNEMLLLRTDVSALVLVTAGAVDAAGTSIVPGAPLAMSGDIALINLGSAPATVVVALIGASPGDAAPPAPTVPPTTEVSAPDTTSAPGATTPKPPTTTTKPSGTPSTSSTTTSTSSSTTTSTTTTEPFVDTDSDGLSDAEEARLGTDPKKADSDIDGIPDGREVNSLGSNPLDTDTDNDGLTDALEVDKSCDINVPDTDGDGLGDAFEANAGFSECSLADTDGDRVDDLAEFSLGTNPRDPNSRP